MSDEFDTSKFSSPVLISMLFGHVLEKGFQAGGILALPLAPALVYFRMKGVFTPASLTRYAGYVAVGVTGLSGILASARLPQFDRDGFEDRVYRLHYNQGQRRTDRFGEVGAVVGLAASAYLLQSTGMPLKALNLYGGAAVGAAVSIGLHLLTKEKKDFK